MYHLSFETDLLRVYDLRTAYKLSSESSSALVSIVFHSILYNNMYPYEGETKRIYGPLMPAAVTTRKVLKLHVRRVRARVHCPTIPATGQIISPRG